MIKSNGSSHLRIVLHGKLLAKIREKRAIPIPIRSIAEGHEKESVSGPESKRVSGLHRDGDL
jgi:hypothetical protein